MDNDHDPRIAIVSSACIFPGAADLDAFWRNIVAGRSAIQPVPSGRWPVDPGTVYDAMGPPDKARSLNAGLIHDVAFRAEGFDLPPEALLPLDPMHHLVLEAGRRAWQSCRQERLDPNRVDVVLAAIALPTDAASHLTRRLFLQAAEAKLFERTSSNTPKRLDAHEAMAAGVTAFPAALLGAALGLGGDTLTLDAACASSLFALKLACDALHALRADAVLAGGVARPDTLYTQIGFTQLQALSRSGRCAPFDHSADGLVVGEGCGMVVLKRLADALAQGDTIQGVICGLGLSNDMRGNLLAPEIQGQVRAMQAAYAAAGWDPRDVDLIECHGAATPVGDATELHSLRTLWGDDGWQRGQCAIGSVKSMIGHLLTAAGAAGLIKVLLGMRHELLPPSLNFEEAPAQSPLHGGPFRVQTAAAPWVPRGDATPRRAAVSAFGFGGINAHLLLEEWRPPPSTATPSVANLHRSFEGEPVAVVGLDVLLGPSDGLEAFQTAVFQGRSAFAGPSERRWKNCRTWVKAYLEGEGPWAGAFLDAFQIHLAEGRIPPKEIPDILAQHLLMLKVAGRAMRDAGLPRGPERPRMGCIVGMEFDLENTNFHLRWDMQRIAEAWAAAQGLDLDEDRRHAWVEALADACAPPLTHTRTLGALGSLIASRMAREFRFGGPSFTISDEAASGLKALSAAVDLLRSGEAEAILVGAVDLPGDLRRILRSRHLAPYTAHAQAVSLDRNADGPLPGEGAAAVVLKRLADARRDGDRIYALLRGMGRARGGHPYEKAAAAETLIRAQAAALAEADAVPATIGYVETHGSGHPHEDDAELQALQKLFRSSPSPPALGALKAVHGHAGAAAGLAGLVKAALTLYHQVLPPLPGYQAPPETAGAKTPFHVPRAPVYWPVDRREGPRRACLDTLTPEGGATVVVLEESPIENSGQASPHRASPLGLPAHGLFLLHGVDTHQLAAQLEVLSAHLDRSRSAGQSIGKAALEWFCGRRGASGARTLALCLADYPAFSNVRDRAHQALQTGTPLVLQGLSGGHFSPHPLGVDHAPVMVFPGAGNHYLGMGRELGAQWPDVWRAANQATDRFAAQCRSAQLVPFRAAWQPGWQQDALAAVNADPVTAICGQVVFGCLTADLLRSFGIAPSAVLGYSLGETVGYFATGAWPDRGRMLERLDASDLFRSELAGPCRSVRRTLPIPADVPVAWRTAVVNRSAAWARERLTHFPALRLLIVNTPDECVIGGHGPALDAFVHKMDCDAVFLDGVVAVHCEAVRPVAEAYRALHRFPTTPPPGLDYYSCARGGRIALTSESAADSLLKQALEGFDFPAVVNQAHADGHRLFLEMGPQASCTRMIRRILAERRHVALSLSSDGANEAADLAKALAILAAEGQAVDLDAYFPAPEQVALPIESPTDDTSQRAVTIVSGGRPLDPPRPPMVADTADTSAAAKEPLAPGHAAETPRDDTTTITPDATGTGQPFFDRTRELMREVAANAAATSNAHRSFLSLNEELGRQYAEAVDLQARLIQQAHHEANQSGRPPAPPPAESATALHRPASPPPSSSPRVAFDRSMCLEFAVGSAARVLGPEFAVVDTYPARVRLPDEPLMLVDRILSVEGRKGSLGPGRLVTEHDVLPNAWYLDGGRAPVCIAVEAGQADLFLCAYLGIDLEVRGKRTYRLLDAAVTFHRGLPRPGEVIRYAIEIEKFIRQGPTWLFFFRFEGTIDGKPLITMRNGCAGFFTEEEVRRSGGIILTEEDRQDHPGIAPADWQPLVPMTAGSYDEAALEALRRGDLEACFGSAFRGIRLPEAQRLPGGRMALIDRVLALDPAGGRYGLGRIRAEADIDPRAWFLTCHFVDDMVMPGTLMYECCAHTLRVHLQRMGWISDRPDVVYEPVPGRPAVLKCRGPVTPETRQVIYEVDIREVGFAPEPYVMADAHMYADGHRIVLFRDMSMKLTGLDRAGLERFWSARQVSVGATAPAGPLFTRERLLAFATGRPSEAFGAPYRPFDGDRFIARLPGPPYAFIHRVTQIEPPPWELAPDGWVQAECDIDHRDWYLRSNGAAFLPICILMEIALQACGFLAAYMGSALKSDKDLHFRNLDGEAVLYSEVRPEGGPVQTRTRLVSASAAGDMLIEHYAFEVQQDRRRIYSGKTSFGFFTADALARQAGLPASDQPAAAPPASSTPTAILEDKAPLTPDDPATLPPGETPLPSRALRMIDRIEVFKPRGGPGGLGYIAGSKTVDPEEWFFKAHFFQDPVCPGSLGIESLIQLLRYAAGAFWPEAILTHAMALVPEVPHVWRYRGQILPSNGRVEVAAVITDRRDRPHPRLVADGTLKCDGLYIYKMQHFGLELRPPETP